MQEYPKIFFENKDIAYKSFLFIVIIWILGMYINMSISDDISDYLKIYNFIAFWFGVFIFMYPTAKFEVSPEGVKYKHGLISWDAPWEEVKNYYVLDGDLVYIETTSGFTKYIDSMLLRKRGSGKPFILSTLKSFFGKEYTKKTKKDSVVGEFIKELEKFTGKKAIDWNKSKVNFPKTRRG